MAELGEMVAITVNDLEGRLGSSRVSTFVHDDEMRFLDQTVLIADRIAWDSRIRSHLFGEDHIYPAAGSGAGFHGPRHLPDLPGRLLWRGTCKDRR
jgi:hypothetical protein